MTRTAHLDDLRTAASTCTMCPLYQEATQTVFGEGPHDAKVMLIGEQPGDREDLAGRPFVGPGGALLDRALRDAGIDRSHVYVTNAVKHFKFTRPERGKRRIHKSPSRTEVVACRPWLLGELREVHPQLIGLLGAVAAKSLLGPSFKITEHRGHLLPMPETLDGEPLPSAQILPTTHPSAVLRAPDRTEAYDALVTDLRVLAKAIAKL
jgi:uracil-DNA glycosylase family protein